MVTKGWEELGRNEPPHTAHLTRALWLRIAKATRGGWAGVARMQPPWAVDIATAQSCLAIARPRRPNIATPGPRRT